MWLRRSQACQWSPMLCINTCIRENKKNAEYDVRFMLCKKYLIKGDDVWWLEGREVWFGASLLQVATNKSHSAKKIKKRRKRRKEKNHSKILLQWTNKLFSFLALYLREYGKCKWTSAPNRLLCRQNPGRYISPYKKGSSWLKETRYLLKKCNKIKIHFKMSTRRNKNKIGRKRFCPNRQI